MIWFRTDREKAEHFLRGGGAELVSYDESRDGVKVVVKYRGLTATGFGPSMDTAVTQVARELIDASLANAMGGRS